MTKSIARAAIGTGLILLIPLTLQLTIGTGIDGQGWNWKLGDFVVIGALLFAAGLAIDFAVRKLTKPTYRVIAVTSIVLLLLVTWIHLAVGIVDSWPFAGS
jgi:hypothetical protein